MLINEKLEIFEKGFIEGQKAGLEVALHMIEKAHELNTIKCPHCNL